MTKFIIGDFGRELLCSTSSISLIDCDNSGPQPGPVDGASGAVTAWTGLIKVDNIAYTWMASFRFYSPDSSKHRTSNFVVLASSLVSRLF